MTFKLRSCHLCYYLLRLLCFACFPNVCTCIIGLSNSLNNISPTSPQSKKKTACTYFDPTIALVPETQKQSQPSPFAAYFVHISDTRLAAATGLDNPEESLPNLPRNGMHHAHLVCLADVRFRRKETCSNERIHTRVRRCWDTQHRARHGLQTQNIQVPHDRLPLEPHASQRSRKNTVGSRLSRAAAACQAGIVVVCQP